MQKPEPAAAATAAAAADAPQQQRLVQLGSLAQRRTAVKHPPCSVASAVGPAEVSAGASRMLTGLPSMMQQPLLHDSNFLMMPPALLASPAPEHAVPAAAAGGMGTLPGSMMPATHQQYFTHAEHSSSDLLKHSNSAAFAQQPATVRDASAGISSPSYLTFAGQAADQYDCCRYPQNCLK